MERTLRKLFDFQKFEGNSRLAAMLADTESRYAGLSDDDLELVSAAGEEHLMNPFAQENRDDE